MGAEQAAANPEALSAAEKEFQAAIADPVAAPVHNSARGLLLFARMRLRPLEELRTIAARVATTRDELPVGDLDNFIYLLDHQGPPAAGIGPDQTRTREAARDASDLVDWLQVFPNPYPMGRDPSIARWQQTQSMPWLVAALTHVQGPHESASALLDAAAAVPGSSPAFATVSFLRVRLLIGMDRIDEARRVLAALPDAPGPGVSQETINLYRGERFKVASTFEELLKAAPRLSVAVTSESYIDRTFAPAISFDEDAAAVFGERLPLDRLVDAAVSTTLPARLRKRIAVAAFTRAALLDRHESARRVAPVLRTLAPPLAADIDRYLRETSTDARRRAALLLILRTPGMTKDVRGLDDHYSIELVEPRRAFENFILPWWCAQPIVTQERVDGEVASELVHILYKNMSFRIRRSSRSASGAPLNRS